MQFPSRQFINFAIAGGTGFIVDTAVLYALRGALGPYGARLVSFIVAVITTWLINRNLAFKAHEKHLPLWREFAQYFAAMLLGGAINFGVYSALVALFEFVAHNPIIGVAFGTGAGLFANFFLAHKFVFSRKPQV